MFNVFNDKFPQVMSTATIDIGNTMFQAIFDGQRYRDFPHVLAKFNHDPNKSFAPTKGSIWDWLKVKVDSPTLSKKWGTVAIGNAALSYNTDHDAVAHNNKHESDTHFLCKFAAIAADALENGTAIRRTDGTYYLRTFLSTFLPMEEFKNKKYRQAFASKLLNGTHIVEFVETIPSHNNKEIEIEFVGDHIEQNPEGMGFQIRLQYNMDGTERELPKTNQTFVTFDLGGYTGDEAYFKDGFEIQPNLSRGHDIGINSLLENIEDAILSDARFRGYNFQNRSVVNQVLLDGVIKTKTVDDLITIIEKHNQEYFIEWHGVPHNVTELVEPKIMEFVEYKLFPIIRKILERPEIHALYMVGGSSVLLKRYIDQYNNNLSRKLPIYFTDPFTSYWGLVESGELLATEYRQENDLLLQEEMEENDEY